jgi:hypothetical protein
LQVERILRFDGADDDKKDDENKTTPRKTSAMGRLWENATNIGGIACCKSPNRSPSGKAGNDGSPPRKKSKNSEGGKEEAEVYSKDSFGTLLPSMGTNRSEVKATGKAHTQESGEKTITVTTSVQVESESLDDDEPWG